MEEELKLPDWYSASQAADVLSRNSKTKVKPAYLRQLVMLGKIEARKIGPRTSLYKKADIDAYRVEPRGKKSARAKKAQARKKQAEAA